MTRLLERRDAEGRESMRGGNWWRLACDPKGEPLPVIATEMEGVLGYLEVHH